MSERGPEIRHLSAEDLQQFSMLVETKDEAAKREEAARIERLGATEKLTDLLRQNRHNQIALMGGQILNVHYTHGNATSDIISVAQEERQEFTLRPRFYEIDNIIGDGNEQRVILKGGTNLGYEVRVGDLESPSEAEAALLNLYSLTKSSPTTVAT
jgi:hypothetical protein